MTADELDAVTAMYDAAGVVARELGRAIDALATVAETPLMDVTALVDAALTRCRRAYDAAAWVREHYG